MISDSEGRLVDGRTRVLLLLSLNHCAFGFFLMTGNLNILIKSVDIMICTINETAIYFLLNHFQRKAAYQKIWYMREYQ